MAVPKQVRLQEACFRDVVVVYRLAVPEGGVSPHRGPLSFVQAGS